MTTSDNQLPIDKQPIGDICIPVSVPNDTQWLWLLAKCLSFPTAKRFWKKGNEADTDIVMAEWDSRVYNPIVEKILARDLCAEAGEDDCLEYPSNHGMINYEPMSPFSEAGTVPDGYLLPPFSRYADILFEDIPDWLADIIADATGLFTGYEPNDVLTLIGSFPLSGDWEAALEAGLPRFTVEVSGKGTLELHFLTVPFGGRAIITLDVEPDIGDIIGGIISGDIQIVELERDFSSVPPELNVEQIHEVTIDTSGDHVVHVTFFPVVDIALIPLRFGGGIRSVVWCSDNIPDEPCDDCDIETVLEDETFFEEEYVPQTFGDWYTETIAHNEELNTAYDDTPQSIGEDIPTGAPNGWQSNALCYALWRYCELYASGKVCIIQSKNFIQIQWNKLANAANNLYNQTVAWMGFIYTPNLFSCFVDDTEAITALNDTSAIEELACFLRDELSGVVMSQSNFDDAILEAATTLTGNAQKIACIMQNDNNLTLYINFLEGYNISINRIMNGEDLECPCEAPDTYWYLDLDLRLSQWLTYTNLSVNVSAVWTGTGWQTRTSNSQARAFIGRNFGDTTLWLAGIKMTSARRGSEGNGTNDYKRMLVYPNQSNMGTETQAWNHNFITGNTDEVSHQKIDYADNVMSFKSAYFVESVNGAYVAGTNYADVYRIQLWGWVHSGYKPQGSVFVPSIVP